MRRRVIGVGIVSAAAVSVFTLVLGPATIVGDSMAPALADGAVVLVDRISHRLGAESGREAVAGDVVIVRSPSDPGVMLAKRVAGVGGDRVAFDAFGRISVNGRPAPPSTAMPDEGGAACQTVMVPRGCYFVVGDNRISSTDSRDFGPVGADAIAGRVRAVVWPPVRVGPVR